MSGSGGDRGYDYQADCLAYVAAHGLAQQPLGWFDDTNDVPTSWLAETGGPGDDFCVVTIEGISIEVQSKHRFQRGEDFERTFRRIFEGLVASACLRAVIMVDKHASAIIRDDLKNDLVRVGQGRVDGFKAITSDLLATFRSLGISDTSVFARLRIVVVDLDEGADGVAAARALLSSVVAPDKSIAAYEMLGKRGHRLIKNRGRDNLLACAQALESAIGLFARSPSRPIVRFANWVRSANETFYSSAMQRRYSIANAWDSVAALSSDSGSDTSASLDSQIKRYQEWPRLADRRRDEAMAAEAFIRDHRLSVVVAGPGSGKSTLAQKLVASTVSGQLALRVRLPVIARLLNEGRSFDHALVEAATDGSGCDPFAGRLLPGMADLLVADGLDECDPFRHDVAAALLAWARGHERCAVCVLTRPTGHAAGMFPGFSHAELLPLGDADIRRLAGWMLSGKQPGPERTSDRLDEFIDALKGNNGRDVRSIAARSPMLLSFLVRLFLDGERLDGKRSQLFERIVEVIRKSPPQLRRQADQPPDRATAWTAAEVAGWSSLDVPSRSLHEISRIVATLTGSVDAERHAESALQFWVNHGLLEVLSVGSRDALTFVHLGFAEFLAGRHIANLDRNSLALALEPRRRKAKWREPIIFAAGAGAAEPIISTLLSFDSPDDPASAESVVAAAAIAEAEHSSVPEDLVRDVVDRLKNRLRSTVPLIAIEAGIGLTDLAPLLPDFVASIAMDLWRDTQEWTSFAASCAGLATGSGLVPIEYVVEWVKGFGQVESGSLLGEALWKGGETRQLKLAALPQTLKRLMCETPEPAARSLAKDLLKRLPIAALEKLESAYTDESQISWFRQIRAEIWAESLRNIGDLAQDMARYGQATRSGLATIAKQICEACDVQPGSSTSLSCDGGVLGAFFESIEYWELSDGALLRIEDADTARVLPVIIRGLVAAVGVDRRLLGLEADSWLQRLVSGDGTYPPRGKRRDHDRHAAAAEGLDLAILANALSHPSQFVAFNAARLLELHLPSPIVGALLKTVLAAGSGAALYLVGYLAKEAWGESSVDYLCERLKGTLSGGCEHLYDPLLNAALSVDQVTQAVDVLVEAVAQEDSLFATPAAETLRRVDAGVLAARGQRLRDSLAAWATRKAFCAKCAEPVTATSCDSCRIVAPNPRAHLVFVLSKIDALSIEDLLSFAEDRNSDVRREALAQMARAFLEDRVVREELLMLLEQGTAPASLLKEVLERPTEQLGQFEEHLIALLEKSPAAVKEQIVGSLDAGWTSAERARGLAELAVADAAPEVRSKGVEILRRLSGA